MFIKNKNLKIKPVAGSFFPYVFVQLNNCGGWEQLEEKRLRGWEALFPLAF